MSRTRAAVFGAATLLGLTLLGACGQSATSGTTQAAVQQNSAPKVVALTSAAVGALGEVLTDANGKTLYRFDNDTANPSVSHCDGDCAEKWPPAIAPEGDLEVQGVDKALVATIDRKDGKKQLTVAGWPLYRFAQDQAPGDAKGQGAGKTWFAATPQGKKAGVAAGPVLATAVVSGLGTVLTTADGRTVYRFDKDTSNPSVSNCEGDCSKKWPPVITPTPEVVVQGVDKALVGTITRKDGSVQVTVGGWPTYNFADDKAPGDAKGQGVGGTWFAAAPDGKKATENKELALTTASVGNLGTILTDKGGMTLYTFDKDTAGVSNCSGDCAKKWPPALVPSVNFQVQGVDKALVGTITRADGTRQLTIKGKPLYTFAEDKLCGEAKGQGSGGVWFVSTPDGNKAGV
jgi:predicted lipoprotein with Yx(FWY)xxD motif